MLDLIMQQGQIQAQGAQASGAIWGNALGGLGSQLIQYGTGRIDRDRAEGERKKQSLAFEAAINSGDPRAIISVLGPRDGPAVITALKAHAPDGMKAYTDRMELGRDQARGILAVPADMRPQAYAFARNGLLQAGVFKPEELPESFEEAAPIIAQVANYGQEPKAEEAYTLAPGQQRRRGSEVVAENPAVPRPETAPTVGSFEDYAVQRFGPRPTAEQITQARKDYQQADDRPRININTPRAMSQTMEANVINRLSGQWAKEVEPVRELDRQVKLLDVGLSEARKGNMAQGAQTILVTFQKILDPPSVVRESEYMRSAAGLAMMDRVKGAVEKLSKGGAGVPVGELEKFADLARQAARAQASGYSDAVKERIGRTADRYNIPRELVFEDFAFDFGGAGGAPSPPTSGGGPVQVSSPAEAQRLAPGTLFQTPDGRIMRVPGAR